MPSPVILENECLRLSIDDVTGVLSVTDKSCGEQWSGDPWLNTAGILALESKAAGQREFLLSQAKEIRVVQQGPKGVELVFNKLPAHRGNEVVDARVQTRLSLVGENGFRVEVLSVEYPADWEMVDLEYPCRWGHLTTDRDQGYLVVPFWQGGIVPSTTGAFEKVPRVPFWMWDDLPWREEGTRDLQVHAWRGLSLPFFGMVRGKSAWAGVFDTEDDAGVRCVMNNNDQSRTFDKRSECSPWQRISACSPLWLSTRRQFGYARSMTYYAIPGGNYNAVAKRYKAIAAGRGMIPSLREKIAQNPNIEKFIGGPLINLDGGYPWYIDYPAYRYTWNDARKFIDDLKQNAGLERALLCLWIGYQNYPPDSYPFHPSNGTIEELQSLVKYGIDEDVLVCFYHGYPCLIDHAPNMDPSKARRINRRNEMKSRWGRNCSAFLLEYAKKNLPASIRDSGQIADYTDMLTASPIEECWDAEHGLTRTQDRRNKEELLKYINSLGLFTGSECPRGWAVPHMAYAKNANWGGNRNIMTAFPIPLFNLVCKDSLVMYREHMPQADSEVFMDIAAGNHTQIHFTWSSYWENREQWRWNIPDVLRLFQTFNRKTACEELLEHHYEDEMNGPYYTRFSDGTEVRVNPVMCTREVDGQALAPESLSIAYGDGKMVVYEAQHAQYRITEKMRD